MNKGKDFENRKNFVWGYMEIGPPAMGAPHPLTICQKHPFKMPLMPYPLSLLLIFG